MTANNCKSLQGGDVLMIIGGTLALAVLLSVASPKLHFVPWLEARLPDRWAEQAADRHLAAAQREVETQSANAGAIRAQLARVNGQIAVLNAKVAEYQSALDAMSATDLTVRVGGGNWRWADLNREITRLVNAIAADERVRSELESHLAEVTAGAEEATRRVQQLKVERVQLARQADGRSRKNNDIDRAETFFGEAVKP